MKKIFRLWYKYIAENEDKAKKKKQEAVQNFHNEDTHLAFLVLGEWRRCSL